MKEELLHTIWKYKLTGTVDYIGTKQEAIKIISIGEHNHHSGPDFFNSKVEINGLLLVGNLEIHVKTSDWLKHKHQYDKAYDNLVLHVVYEHDVELPQNEQYNVSVLELKNHIKSSLLHQYQSIESSKQKIPCGKSITTVSPIIWKSWLDRLAVSRLEDKTNYISTIFNSVQQNLEETLYVLLCRNFGFKINNDAFELLAKSTPYYLLKKHADQPLQLEALLYGNAGFLDDLFKEKYPISLQNEFEFLKHKYALIPLKKEIWKFSKTRPSNFPTIRLSQLICLISKQQSLFHFIEKQPTIPQLKNYFNVETNVYFKSHFKFDSPVTECSKHLGDSAFYNIVINTIVPFLFFVSKQNFNADLQDYAFDLLEQIPAEINTKTKAFTNLGVIPESALETQAMIKLHDSYCSIKSCLNCHVAEFLLKNS
jgi:hypothetical protein